MSIDLSKVTTEVKEEAPGIIIYSLAGAGKSTFLANMCKDIPNSLLIQCGEKTLAGLKDEDKKDVPHYPDVLGGGTGVDERIEKYEEFQSLIGELLYSDHNYSLVAFDNLDNIININMEAHVVKTYYRNDTERANDFGGKKCVEMMSECNMLIDAFKDLQRKGITVVASFHGQIITSKEPTGADYDTYTLGLPAIRGGDCREPFINWADELLFGTVDTVVVKKKAKGGSRVLKTDLNPCYKAKSRKGLPELEFKYDAFKKHYTGEVEKEEPKKKGGK